MKSSLHRLAIGLAALAGLVAGQNSTFLNPVLPGWHSDPSCVQVEGIFYCVTSTFIVFPGLPVYASKDLINWRLISHAWNRESQLPGVSWRTEGQQEGMFAATIRHHDDTFYVICEYLGMPQGILGVLFKSTDPLTDAAWSDPVNFSVDKIDPDLFWDDDGKVYMASQGIVLQEIDIDTGRLSAPVDIWQGTGGVWPEGPHFYKRDDGYYYLLIAEGGTAQDHAITMARARNIRGPYEAYPRNPVSSNRRTNEYFQTVGHADLFQDVAGNWWGMSLATRSGPAYQIYPMGREAVLFPVTWEEGQWPVMAPVRGRMEGWPLPPATRDVPGDGPFNGDPDKYDFAAGSSIPPHFVYWRVPREGSVTIPADADGLRLVPSRETLSGNGQQGLAFVARRQTHSLFVFSVDVTLPETSSYANLEAGVTVFLTQMAHIDLAVRSRGGAAGMQLRFQGVGNTGAAQRPAAKAVDVPDDWAGKPIRLFIEAPDSTSYRLSAASALNPNETVVLGTGSAALLSGDTGSFVGSLLGVYATCNGAGSADGKCPEGGSVTFTRWRYQPVAQQISATEVVPV